MSAANHYPFWDNIRISFSLSCAVWHAMSLATFEPPRQFTPPMTFYSDSRNLARQEYPPWRTEGFLRLNVQRHLHRSMPILAVVMGPSRWNLLQENVMSIRCLIEEVLMHTLPTGHTDVYTDRQHGPLFYNRRLLCALRPSVERSDDISFAPTFS